MRPRKQDRHLPKCMYQKHGAYYLVRKGKWTRLDTDYQAALLQYAKLTARGAQGGMSDLIDKTMAYIGPKLQPNTMEQYSAAAERLKKIFSDFAPRELMPRHVAAMKVQFAATPNMCNRLLSVLSRVFQHGLELQLVDTNPCAGVKRHAEAKRDRYITHAEFEQLLAHSSDYMGAIWTMCYLTGQRIGDVLKIRMDAISEGGIAFRQQKTGAKLVIGMTPDIQAAIDRALALPRKKRGDTLFCTRDGRPVSYDTCKDAFRKIREAAGLENIKIHDLRAKSLTDADGEGKDAQKLGGHTDARMTARYLRGRKPKLAQAPNLPKNGGEY